MNVKYSPPILFYAGFQKFLILVIFFSLFVFTSACRESEENLLKKDSQAVAQLSDITNSMKANRLTSEEIENLKKIQEKYPNLPQVNQIYLQALILRNDWQTIAELLGKKNVNQLTREEKISLAKVHFKLGEYQKTIDSLAPLPEKDIQAKNLLGQAFFQSGQTDKALAVMEEIKPESVAQKRVDDLSLLGLIYLRQNDAEKAVEILRKAIEINPDHIASNNALSLAYLRKGEEANAEIYRKKTSELQKKAADETFQKSRRVQIFYDIEKAWSAKNYDEVIKLADEALQLTADNNEKLTLYQYLFESYKAQGNDADAEKILAEAQKLQQQK